MSKLCFPSGLMPLAPGPSVFCILLLMCLSFAGQASAASFDEEYSRMGSLDSIQAAQAYSLGFSGQGVTVAVIDTGARPSHQEFSNKDPYLVEKFIYVQDPDHGVHVAGIVAAAKNNLGMHGVAYDARLISLAAIEGFPLNPYEDPAVTAIKALVKYPQAQIVNNSWGIGNFRNSNLAFYERWKNADKQLYSETGQAMAEVVQANDALFIVAAGNDGLPSPSIPAGLPSFLLGSRLGADYQKDGGTTIPAYNAEIGKVIVNNFINVAAYDQQALSAWGTASPAFVASFSNMADGASGYTVMAPGVDIYSAIHDNDNAYATASGTSMATPHVSGVAALVKQAFPYMGGKQLADVLLSTTNSLGINDVSRFFILFRNRDFGTPEIYTYDNTIDNSILTTHAAELRQIFYATAAHYPEEGSEYDKAYQLFLNELRDILNNKATSMFFHEMAQEDYIGLYGMGIINAYKAVQGPGYFDAGRLDQNRDLSVDEFGAGSRYAMYRVDSKGFDSIWSNDIGQKINGDPGNALFNLPVGLHKSGQGILYLTGRNSYGGPTLVEEGMLSLGHSDYMVQRASLNSDVWVREYGAFAGNGQVNGNLYSENGVLLPGLIDVEGTTLSIDGDVQHNGTLILLVSNLANNQANQLYATGDITLAGDFLVDGNDGEPASPYQHFSNPVVKADGTLSISPDYTWQDSLSAFMSFRLYQLNNELYFELTTNALDSLPGLPWETRQVATSLEGLYHALNGQASQRDLDYLYNMEASSFINAANQLRGDIQASTLLAPGMIGTFNNEMLAQHKSEECCHVNNEDAASGHNLWIRPLYSYGRMESRDAIGQDSLSLDRLGFAAGVETHTAIKGLSLGIMGGYDHAWLSQGDDNANIDDLGLGAYALWRSNPWQINAFIATGLQQYDVERKITTNTGEHKLDSDFSGWLVGGGLSASYNLLPPDDPTVSLRPYAGLDIWRVAQQNRREDGHCTLGLDVQSDYITRINFNTGLMLEYQPTEQSKLYLLAGYKRVLHGYAPELRASFVGADSSGFFIISPEQDRDLFVCALASEFELSEQVSIAASLQSELSGHSSSVGGSLAFNFCW